MKIAILEDDVSMRKSLQYSLSDYDITCFKNPADAIASGILGFDIFISDINMPKMDGIEFIRYAQLAGSQADFIIITGNASLQKSIEALRLGVRDFLTKPFSTSELEEAINKIITVRRAKEEANRSSARATAKSPHEPPQNRRDENCDGDGGENSGENIGSKSADDTPKSQRRKSAPKDLADEFFVCRSSALDVAINMAQKAAATDISVLLNGPSGAGKEVFARFIHAASARAKKPFVAINMAALPEALCESELFGYCKGAFTDATRDKEGLFALANGGTLFLDEIGEMPASLQPKILRAVQEKKITPLGGAKSIDIDVRIISATNIDLQSAIAAKDFRSDLFYRLGAFCVQIAPLSQRREEILPLFWHFYERSCTEFNKPPQKLSPAAKKALLDYPFDGNIRELICIAQRAAILADGAISTKDLCLLNYQGEI